MTWYWITSLCLFCQGVTASPTPASWRSQVRQEYQGGLDLFRAHKYDQAIIRFHKADYLLRTHCPPQGCLRPRKIVWYYLGICYYRLKQYRSAQKFLQAYQKAGPRPQDQAKVQQLLRFLESRHPTKRRRTMPPPPRRPQHQPRRRPLTGPVVLITGGALLAIGLISGILSASAFHQRDLLYEEHKNAPSPQHTLQLSQLEDQGRSFAITANILFALGAVTALTGSALWLFLPPVPVTPTRGS